MASTPPVRLSADRYWSDVAANNLSGMLLIRSYHYFPRLDPDTRADVIQDTLYRGYLHLHTFDATAGYEGLVRWLEAMLRLEGYAARRGRRRPPTCSLEEVDDARWAQIACRDAAQERADLADAELVAEAKLRLRLADLTELQAACLGDRLNGVKLKATAKRLEISEGTVCGHIQAAVKKLRAVPVELLQSPDVDWHAIRIGSAVSIYHRPTTLGAGLAREQLAKMK